MLKVTSEFKTLKRCLNISADLLYRTRCNNLNILNRSLCSSGSLLGYGDCGGVYNDKNVYFGNVEQSKYSLFRTQNRSFSAQSSLDSVVQSYAHIFKSLSESTVVQCAQNMVIMIHDQSGLPWWASIMLTTVLIRSLVTLPLSLYQNYVLAKLAHVSIEMTEIAKEAARETTIAVKQFQWTEAQAKLAFRRAMKKQWTKLIERDNCHPAKASLLIWFQIPMWLVFSVALRNIVYMMPHNDTAAYMRYLELCTGGFLWMPNLTVADSFVLPITLGLTNLAIIEIQSMMSTQEKRSRLQKYATNFFRCITILMIPLAAVVPSCLSLYWTTSSVYGLAQNLILMSPRLKQLLGIPKLPNAVNNPYEHLVKKIKQRFV